ncbi:uncharacterized protein LOC110463149 [Mizuhopecten yessoensis]|uniref:C2H2-type domain-containing protein n=1 Tax=Mizuhopecten yessoensis TaxID=6573 RepID=A0A210PWS7_MIZYE|nr:uncharacterized protein LOC110463149 [Mizuhopecten yessoensis]OWF40940.1 hypothetical protein KP79_PYT15968 [Mizuhopecten yessoensis]
MDETAIPKIPAKLITRSKAKSSTGYRQIVNFLDNLSRDETGAPVKWKFNQTGVKLARGIGKKIADAGKQGTTLKYDARTSLVKAVLRKKYSSSKVPSSCTFSNTRGKNTADSDESTNTVINGDTASVTNESRLPQKVGIHQQENKSVTKKTGKGKDELSSDLAESACAPVAVPRKRGRPPKKKTEPIIDSLLDGSVKNKKTAESVDKVQSWTNLNQKLYKKSLLGNFIKKNVDSTSLDDSADSDSRVDSEVETESVGSSVSSVSVKKKMKQMNRAGIMLGPAKLLRSQDSLMTRKSKGMKASLVQAHRKPRKRTLSGGFELLDENLLRKKLRQDEDHQSDIDSDYSEGIQKNLTKLDDSEEECTSVTGITKVTSDTSKKPGGKKSILTDDKNTLPSMTNIVPVSSTNDPNTALQNINIVPAQPKKRGRPPRVKPIVSSSEPIKIGKKTKLLGPKCAQERARNMLRKRNDVAIPRTGLQIIGPGGLVFMRKSVDLPQKLISNDSLHGHESNLKADILFKDEVSSTNEKYTCDKDIQSTFKQEVPLDIENKSSVESVVKSMHLSIDTKENVVPPEEDISKTETTVTKSDITSKTEESLNSVEYVASVKCVEDSGLSDADSFIKDCVSDKDNLLIKEKKVKDASLTESIISNCELNKATQDSETNATATETDISTQEDTVLVSVTVIQSPTCESSPVSEKNEQEQQITSSDAKDIVHNTCKQSAIDDQHLAPCANRIDQMKKHADMDDPSNRTTLASNLKEIETESASIELNQTKTVVGESCESLKITVRDQEIVDDTKTESEVFPMETSATEEHETNCKEVDRNENLDISLESKEVDMYNSVPQYTEDSCKKKDDSDGKTGKLSPLSDDDRTDAKVDSEKKLGVKREFQLRQKASRSPLEIIAMRQSQEERQYILEQTQKAMKREEKQKKMREKIKKIENENMEKCKEERKKEEKAKVVEHITEENLEKEEDNDEVKVPEEKPEDIKNAVQIDEEREQKSIVSEHAECKACSVVLIDFVKYLKMTNSSYSVESGSVMEEWETIADTETTLSEESTESSIHEETHEAETEVVPKLSDEEPKQFEDVLLKSDDDGKSSNKVDENKPAKKKRKPSARKQARCVTYSAQLTAEIVSNPFFNGDETQTVPPLRLKIKQNIIAKPKPRSKKGMKFTVKKRRTARKGMPSEKGLPNTGLFLEGTDSAGTAAKKTDNGKSSFEKSYVEFYHNQGYEHKVKASRKQKNSKTNNHTFSFETITDEENALSKQTQPVNNSQDNTIVFQCTHNSCGFVSETKRVMESHIYVHMKNIPFRCVHCNEVFQSRGLTFLHMRSVHPDLDARMEAAEKVDEGLFYKEMEQTPPNSLQSPSRETTVIDSLPDTVAPLKTSSGTTGCYCCSHCDFSAPSQQDILNHIHSFHSNDIQYTCTLCNMSIPGSKEGIPNHFAKAHPNQPVTYKCLPEFYDVTKNQQNAGNADKGNIFDRMNDLFTTDQHESHGRPHVQKTSAEADSTTAEMDDSSRKEELDGIEELGKSYQSGIKRTANQNTGIQGIPIVYAAMQTIPGPKSVPLVATGLGIQQPLIFQQEPAVVDNNDMGLKIVDVVSLSDLANTWNQQSEQTQEKSQNVQAVEHEAVLNSNPLKECGQLHMPQNPPQTDPQHILLQMQYEQRQKQQRILQKQQQQEAKKSDKQDSFGTTYKCEKCNVHAPILSAMVEHLRVTHKDIQRLFLCPYCRQYEGSNEPEIHRHIKQYHQTPDQKSPPVALSSAAKKHLRTIQVAVDADSKKVGDRFVVEKDIYKCLKCQKHMPSLNFIYDHLDKAHHEVFVYVCPYCKIFKAKTEAQVFHHIKSEHKKCTEDIMLSLAIEENLFTRVQSLVKEKPSRPTHAQKSQQGAKAPSKGINETEDEVIVVGESHKLVHEMTSPPKPMQPNIPKAPIARMRMPSQFVNPPPAHFQQSKSSLRKSTPHHIPPQSQHSEKEIFEHQNYQQFNIPRNRHGSALPKMAQTSTVPPPLMRAPPPLLRFPSDGNASRMQNQGNVMKAYASQTSGNTVGSPSYSHVNQRVISHQQSQHLSTANVVPSLERKVVASSASQMSTARPVLRVPSVPLHIQQQRPAGNLRVSPYQDFNHSPGPMAPVNRKGDGYAPLDLSKSPAPPSQPKNNIDEGDDLPPDAFQIFNLRPAAQQIRPQVVQQQMTPMVMRNMSPLAFQARFRQQMQLQQQMNRIPMARAPRQHRALMNRPPPYTRTPRHSRGVPRPYTPRSAINQAVPNVLPTKEVAAPIQPTLSKDGRNMVGLGLMRVFKCPYCPDVVPLGMGEVAPHIEKVHPGHSIVFMKIDK